MSELVQNNTSPLNATLFSTKQIFRQWERLRIFYNVIRACVLIMLTNHYLPKYIYNYDFFIMCIGGFLGANICFTVGAVVDAYISWLGWRNIVITIILFILGTTFSILLEVSMLFDFIYGVFD